MLYPRPKTGDISRLRTLLSEMTYGELCTPESMASNATNTKVEVASEYWIMILFLPVSMNLDSAFCYAFNKSYKICTGLICCLYL